MISSTPRDSEYLATTEIIDEFSLLQMRWQTQSHVSTPRRGQIEPALARSLLHLIRSADPGPRRALQQVTF